MAAGSSSSTFWAEILGILSSLGPPLPIFLRETIEEGEGQEGQQQQEGVRGEGRKIGSPSSSSSWSIAVDANKEEGPTVEGKSKCVWLLVAEERRCNGGLAF